MKANLGKCHMLLSSTESINFQISETVIHNSQSKKLLGVTFDNKLKFEKHINTICQKGNRKLNALARIAPYMELKKQRILMNAFFDFHFNYCPLIWMFHSRNLNNKTNSRYRSAVYGSYTMIKHQVSNSSLKMIILSLYTVGISKHLPLKCIK